MIVRNQPQHRGFNLLRLAILPLTHTFVMCLPGSAEQVPSAFSNGRSTQLQGKLVAVLQLRCAIRQRGSMWAGQAEAEYIFEDSCLVTRNVGTEQEWVVAYRHQRIETDTGISDRRKRWTVLCHLTDVEKNTCRIAKVSHFLTFSSCSNLADPTGILL